MKKIHLVAGKDQFRTSQQYIQIKNGFAYATNSHICIKMPLVELFGNESDLNSKDYNFYIKANDWQKQGFYKAFSIKFLYNDPNAHIIAAFDKKNNQIGMIEIITEDAFKTIAGSYPDIESILPENNNRELEQIDAIGLNPELLFNLCEAIGQNLGTYKLSFYGQNRTIKVTTSQCETIGILMPCLLPSASNID